MDDNLQGYTWVLIVGGSEWQKPDADANRMVKSGRELISSTKVTFVSHGVVKSNLTF